MASAQEIMVFAYLTFRPRVTTIFTQLLNCLRNGYFFTGRQKSNVDEFVQ